MKKLFYDIEFLAAVLLMSMFLSCAVVFAADEPAAPRPQVDNPTATELQARLEKDKKYQTCRQKLESLRAACRTSAGNLSLPGGYVCENRQLRPSSTPVAVEGGEGCMSSAQVIASTGIPECGNPTGGTNAADPKYCTGGLRRIQWTSPITRSEFEKMKERSGIRCLMFRGNFAPESRTSRLNGVMQRQTASAVLAAETTNSLEVCADDAHKLQGNTAAQAAPRPVAVDTTAPRAQPRPVDQDTTAPRAQPRPVDQDTTAPRAQPRPVDQDTTAPRPAAVDTTGPRVQPRSVEQDTTGPRQVQPTPVGRDTTAPFVATNQQGMPTGVQQQAAYQTHDQRPTGVQTGRIQRDDTQTGNQQREELQPRRVAQNPRVSSVIQNFFSSNSQQQQQQQTIVINTPPQPWFVAEMKRMEEARAKADAEKRLAQEKQKKEKLEQEKNAKERQNEKKNGTERLIAVKKGSDTKKTDEEKAQDLFLKALNEAPSIEEVAKQYEEEQKKEQEQYAKDQTARIAQKISSSVKQDISKVQNAPVGRREESQQFTGVARTDKKAAPTTELPLPPLEAKKPPTQKSSIVSMLDEQALKKGIPAPAMESLPLPERIAFTRASYTITVPAVRQAIKTIMRAYQRPEELTQLARDKHALQLLSLSEQLAGSAYGADYDTTQVLNDAARAAELTAFMVAERSDTTAIVDSLHSLFATLTPLTKSEPVALTPPSGSVSEWSEQHFALIKYKIETAMQDTTSVKAKELYAKALGLVTSAELYKKSDQQYWDSSTDIKEAVRTLSLATAVDRASRVDEVERVSAEQVSEAQKEKNRQVLLKDKGQEKGIWSSLLNVLGL